jgi:hypothetical protein
MAVKNTLTTLTTPIKDIKKGEEYAKDRAKDYAKDYIELLREVLALHLKPERGSYFDFQRINSFLKEFEGKACWLADCSGEEVERGGPSYLIFKRELAGEVRELVKELLPTCRLRVEVVDVKDVVERAVDPESIVLGRLEVGGVELGVPDPKRGFWLVNGYEYVRAEKGEVKFVRRKDGIVAPMLVLENAVVQVYRGGEVIAELRYPCYAPWLSGILRTRLDKGLLPEVREKVGQ